MAGGINKRAPLHDPNFDAKRIVTAARDRV
jgi:hypothetical protein